MMTPFAVGLIQTGGVQRPLGIAAQAVYQALIVGGTAVNEEMCFKHGDQLDRSTVGNAQTNVASLRKEIQPQVAIGWLYPKCGIQTVPRLLRTIVIPDVGVLCARQRTARHTHRIKTGLPTPLGAIWP